MAIGQNNAIQLFDSYGAPIDHAATQKERQYAAAKITNSTGDWIPANQDINTLIRTSSPILRSRIKQLVRDFPYFGRAINILVNYSVGPEGVMFQSRVKDSDGNPDKKSIQKIEDAVAWGMEELDIARKLDGSEMERLAKRQEVEQGEFLFVKTFDTKDKTRYIPYSLQVYESDWLSSAYGNADGDNEIDQGIEYDKQSGKVIAYHLAVPSGFNMSNAVGRQNSQRILAEFVLHNFETKNAGQLRGVSPFVTAVLIAHDLGDYLDSTVDTAKLAARYLGIVTTMDPVAFQNDRGVKTTDGKRLDEIENAIIEYLRPGETIEFANNNMPGDSFTPFTKFTLRMLAISTDTTYELLSGDYDGISFSNLRGIRNDFASMIRPHSKRHILHWKQPVVRDIIHYSVLAGKLDLPGYWREPRHYWRGVFTPPGMESVDLLRESKAWVDLIKAKLRSPQEYTAARGRDFEEIVEEIAAAKEILKANGLEIEDISTALQQNPAKLGATEKDEEKSLMETLEGMIEKAVENSRLLNEKED